MSDQLGVTTAGSDRRRGRTGRSRPRPAAAPPPRPPRPRDLRAGARSAPVQAAPEVPPALRAAGTQAGLLWPDREGTGAAETSGTATNGGAGPPPPGRPSPN